MKSVKTDCGTVYSTGVGRVCPGCGWPAERCACSRAKAPPPAPGGVRLLRDRKARRGKTVTIVTGLPLDAEQLRALAAELKQRCGAGGTVKDGAVEIQGDHLDTLADELTRRGIRFKISGG